MKIVKVITLKIFDSEIHLYENQKENFEAETKSKITDEEFVRTFIYNDVFKEME